MHSLHIIDNIQMQKLPELKGQTRRIKRQRSKHQIATPSNVTVSGQVFSDTHRQRQYEHQREVIYALNAEATKRENALFEKFMETKTENDQADAAAIRM